jgi:hypothetical protein
MASVVAPCCLHGKFRLTRVPYADSMHCHDGAIGMPMLNRKPIMSFAGTGRLPSNDGQSGY